MSSWRERTKQVREQGTIKRRNWNPPADSFHLKMYRWWQQHSKHGNDRSMENFCHYWRVVCIWAPLQWLKKPLLYGLIGLLIAGIITAIVVTPENTVPIIVGIAGGFYFLGALLMLRHFYGVLTEDESEEIPQLRRLNMTQLGLLSAVMFPALIVAGLFVALIALVMSLIYGLHTDYNVFNRSKQAIKRAIVWCFEAHVSDRWWLTWIRPILLLPVALGILGIWYPLALSALIGMLGAVLLLSLVALILLGFDWLNRYNQVRESEREEERARRRQAVLREHYDPFFRNMFAMYHPEHVGDEERYEKWLARYTRWIEREWYGTIYEIGWKYHLFYRRDERAYRRLFGDPEKSFQPYKRPVAPPSKPRRRMANVLGFFSFLWSIVLVNKWKICPIVTVPTN